MTGPVERAADAPHLAATAAVLAALFLSGSAAAQDQPTASTWPEKPQNLQVLPKDWPGARLRAPMRGFARALGVSCAHCHVGEGGLNGFGYQLLGADGAKAAVAVFRLNTELFPQSANVWDSLAEGLERAGDAAGAISNYEKSLALDPANENAREQLRRLREKGEN